jgi:GNAT superfamily N-acetyltransferase/uncharacterized protein YjiS (DUF1127 family)
MRDRRLRFGTSLAPTAIAAYVDRIDFDHDAVLGIHDDRRVLVGVAHLAFEDDCAELALSVLPAHRGRGIGSALFKRAMAHARKRCIPRLLMHFLSENAPIARIAQRFGMDIVAVGGNADAHLKLQPYGFGDVATTDVVSSARPTSYDLHRAAGARRSFSLGEIIVAVFQAAGAIARRAQARYRQRRQARAIRDALHQLDDRALRDLGFDRSEIASVAAEVTGEAERTRVRAIPGMRS